MHTLSWHKAACPNHELEYGRPVLKRCSPHCACASTSNILLIAIVTCLTASYYIASSVSRQDVSNPVLWLATRSLVFLLENLCRSKTEIMEK